jgi:transcriptional regulator with XRE-family HTH domain
MGPLVRTSSPPVGTLLRAWRERRRWSQLELALQADVSARHVSCMETGRALPSREMLLRLSERLEVPLRERNALLLAAGYAPLYVERPLHDPAMAAPRRALEGVLAGHEPYPALVVNRHWELLMANQAARLLLAGLDPALAQPPLNVLRVALHPQGLAPRIVNLESLRVHLLARLRRQVELSRDPVLEGLLEELQVDPPAGVPPAGVAQAAAGRTPPGDDLGGVAVPLQLLTPQGVLSFISTVTVFGTPVDITLSELALEAFFPADAATAQALQDHARQARAGTPATATGDPPS